MTDEELLLLSSQGFIPGPAESESDFSQRVAETKLSMLKLGEEILPASHWDWVGLRLQKLFDFSPHCLPAFYSNRSLMPWQGAAAWVERGRILAIQLRVALKKGSFLGLYQREEILAHEAVHAARSAFPLDCWDEFFAYMTSNQAWRRALGPIVQRPWEVWPFLVFCVLSVLSPVGFLALGSWLGLGFFRLITRHRILHKSACHLQRQGCSEIQVRSILFRLTDQEIRKVAQGKVTWDAILGDLKATPRGRLLSLAYSRLNHA